MSGCGCTIPIHAVSYAQSETAMQVKLKHEQCRLNSINAVVQHIGQGCNAHLQLLKSPQTLNGCDTVTVQVQATQLWAQVQALY